MNQTVTMRLTPNRERLLKLFKKRFKLSNNSEAIELALEIGLEKETINYKTKLKKVSGCIKLSGEENSVERIRSIRNGI